MKKQIFSYAIILVGIFLFYQNNSAFAAPGDASDWNNYDDYVVIDHDTIWTGTITRADIQKPVVVVNESVLTIEKGTTVEIGNLTVYSGHIVAIGTETEPIHFIKMPIDYSGVPVNYAPYDRECYSYPEAGMIEFASWADSETLPSVFRNVVFEGMGTYEWYGNDNCPWSMSMKDSFRNFFVKTANAAQNFLSNPALKLSSGKVQIEHSTFKDNVYADIETSLNFYDDWGPYDSLEITDTNFSGNNLRTAVIANIQYDGTQDFSGKIVLKNNWYGTSNGPTTEKNPGGVGEHITGTFTLDGWSATEFTTSACTENCFSNVLFLPGIESSRLYAKDDPNCLLVNCENQLWEPNRNDDVRALFLNTDGKSTNAFNIYTKESDIIDELNVTGSNIYKSFIDTMNKLKDVDHLINDWKATPYDWRLSYDDIVNNGTVTGGTISYNQSSSSPYILTQLRRLAENSRTGKVTLVAHSNGGLVAKKLMEMLGDTETARLIDKVILVAVPQVGTPMSIPAMLHGFDQDHVAGLVTSKKTARGLAEYMPGAYQLLPSEKYFATVTTPVVTFDATKLPDWAATYGENISSFETLQSFLTDTMGRVSADNSDIETPIALHTNLLDQSNGVHQSLDNWQAPDDVEVIEIAGWGVPATVDGAHYDTEKKYTCDKGSGLCSTGADVMRATPRFTVDGDGTVVTPSALWMNNNDGAIRYWINLKSYNTDNPFETGLGFFSIEHSKIFEVPQLNTFIADKLTQITKPLSDYSYLSTEAPVSTSKRLEYALHSPLTLDLYDNDGHHTGISPTTGQIEEQIPGTYYRQFGEVKYIFSDELIPTHLTLDGYDTGRFTLEVKELQGDTTLGQMTFQDMPTTDKTGVTLDIPTDLSSVSPLRIDQDGDGTDDLVIAPRVGDLVVFDATPPVTSIALVGTAGANDWYTGDVNVTLTAQDMETGVDHISYSLDNGSTWDIYTSPLVVTVEGTTTVQYFSTNTQGSKESIQIKTIKIDKTAPEAKAVFNPTTQKLDVIGIDNLSAVSVTIEDSSSQTYEKKSEKGDEKKGQSNMKRNDGKEKQDESEKTRITTTLRDDAGHTTVLVFQKKRDKENRIDLKWQSIVYDGNVIAPHDTAVQYQWQLDHSGVYKTFSTYMTVDRSSLLSRYMQKQNETWILAQPREIDDSEERGDEENEKQSVKEKISGMIIPSMTTEKGVIKINH